MGEWHSGPGRGDVPRHPVAIRRHKSTMCGLGMAVWSSKKEYGKAERAVLVSCLNLAFQSFDQTKATHRSSSRLSLGNPAWV